MERRRENRWDNTEDLNEDEKDGRKKAVGLEEQKGV